MKEYQLSDYGIMRTWENVRLEEKVCVCECVYLGVRVYLDGCACVSGWGCVCDWMVVRVSILLCMCVCVWLHLCQGGRKSNRT